MKFEYSHDHKPPALMVKIEVADEDRNRKVELDAKVDTGAGVSLLPESSKDALELTKIYKPLRPLRVHGAFDDDKEPRDQYYIQVRLPWRGDTWVSVRVALFKRPYFLLGRDLLNDDVLHAYGPQGVFEIESGTKPAGT